MAWDGGPFGKQVGWRTEKTTHLSWRTHKSPIGRMPNHLPSDPPHPGVGIVSLLERQLLSIRQPPSSVAKGGPERQGSQAWLSAA